MLIFLILLCILIEISATKRRKSKLHKSVLNVDPQDLTTDRYEMELLEP